MINLALLCCFFLSMRISKKFIKSSLIYTVAGILPTASAIILLPFYIQYLSAEDYGALSIYLSFSLLSQILTTYSFDASLYIHYQEFKNEPKKLNSFVSSAFLLMLLIGCFVVLIFTVSGGFLFGKVFSETVHVFYPYGFLAITAGVFQALVKVNGNLLQSQERPQAFIWLNVMSLGLIILFSILGMKLYPNTLIGPVGGRLLACLISGAWVLSRIFREYGFHFDFPLLKASFNFNLYIFIYQVLQWVNNYFDKIIMAFFGFMLAVGTYDFALKCLIIIELIMNGLHNSFLPKIFSGIMSQTEKKSSPEFNRYYHGFISVIMILICLSILMFPWVIEKFVNKPDYQQAIQYIPYIGIIYILKSIRLFFSTPYSILKYTRPLPIMYLIVSSVKIVLTIVLVKEFFVYGVIMASFASAIIEIILLGLGLKGRFKFQFNVFKVILMPCALLVSVVVLEPLLGGRFPTFLHSFYVIYCGGLLWWAYRNEIKLINPFKMWG